MHHSFVGAASWWDTWLVECCQSIRGWRVWVRGRWSLQETTEDYARLLHWFATSECEQTFNSSTKWAATVAEHCVCSCCSTAADMHHHSLKCPVDSAVGQYMYFYVTTSTKLQQHPQALKHQAAAAPSSMEQQQHPQV